VVQALVVCDALHEDPVTGKWYLLETFSRINAFGFPLTIPAMAVCASVTDGEGVQTLSQRLVDESGDEIAVADQDHELSFSDVLAEFDLYFSFTNLVFYGPGIYRLQLFSDLPGSTESGKRRLTVLALQEPEP
jgi:hypothetical protein